MRNGFEWLRVVTPILVSISLFMMGQLYFQMNDLNQRLFQHMTNAELHVPRADIVLLQAQMEHMRQEILETIRRQNHPLP